jgi:hypothetical protein
MAAKSKSRPEKVRTSFYIYLDYKTRIDACLDEGRLSGALPMSCDDMSAFINSAVEKELRRVEDAIKSYRKSSK